MRTILAVLAMCAVGSMALLPLAEQPRSGKRTLVVLDNESDKSSYSRFLGDLEERGHSVTIEEASSRNVALESYGEFLYDNVVLLATSTGRKWGSLTSGGLTAFVEGGGNVLGAGSGSGAASVLSSFASEMGVDFASGEAVVRDDSEGGSVEGDASKTRIVSRGVARIGAVFGADGGRSFGAVSLGDADGGVAFNGVPLLMSGNELQLALLRGSSFAYSDGAASAGAGLVLVAGVQARNNARVVLSGSAWTFSNEAFGVKGSWNAAFTREASRWAFQERGVLRLRDVTHRRSDGQGPEVMLARKQRPDLPRSTFPEPEIGPNSDVYRIKDELVWEGTIERFDGKTWKPYTANDVQLEFVMLDPYVRVNMTDAGNGLFRAEFRAPDQYGVFKFRLMYRRPGLSVIHDERNVVVRPFRHNEYPRYLTNAYPYYATILGLGAYVLIFAVLFLKTKPVRPSAKTVVTTEKPKTE